MDPVDVTIGLIGLFLLGKLVFGSIAAGFGEARSRLEPPAEATTPAGGLPWQRFATPVRTSLIGVGAALALGFAVYRLFFMGGSGTANEPAREPNTTVATFPPDGNPQPATPEVVRTIAADKLEAQTTEQATAQSVMRVQTAAAKVKQQQAAALAGNVLAMIDAWEQELDLWDNNVSGLMTSAKGQALATQRQLVKRYRAIVAFERPSREGAEALRSSVQSLLGPIQLALDNPADAMVPDEAITKQLQDLLQKAREARDGFRKPRVQIESLVSHALASGEPGRKPLRDVLKEQEEEDALAATAVIEAEEQKAREENTRLIARARKEQIDAAGKAEADRIRAETDAKRTLGEFEVKRIAEEARIAKVKSEREMQERLAAARQEELERKFQAALPEIQRLLKPFITDGYTQLVSGGYQKTATKGPVSFSRIQGAGHLERTTEGIQSLRSAMWVSGANDRDLGAFPDYYNRDWQPGTLRAQELLIEFGPLMVKKKMLAE